MAPDQAAGAPLAVRPSPMLGKVMKGMVEGMTQTLGGKGR